MIPKSDVDEPPIRRKPTSPVNPDLIRNVAAKKPLRRFDRRIAAPN